MNKFKVGDLVVRSVKSNWPNAYGRVGEVGTVTRVMGAASMSVLIGRGRELVGTGPDNWSFYAHSYTEEDLESIIG
jgi:hypothetical protein